MASVGNVYQTVFTLNYLGKVINNVFHDVLITVGSPSQGAEALEAIYEEIWTEVIAPLVVTGIELATIYVINLALPTDFKLATPALPGGVAVGAENFMPSYNALSFRWARIAPGQRYGFKRFAGISDTMVAGNSFTGATALTDALAATLQETKGGVEFDGWAFNPFIAHRPIVLGTNPTGYTPNGCVFRGLTTQNTRK